MQVGYLVKTVAFFCAGRIVVSLLQSIQLSMKLTNAANKLYVNGVKLLLLSVIIIIIISVYQSQQVIKSGKKITNTEEVLLFSKKIQKHALENESGFRAYILSGRKRFLEPLKKLKKEIYGELEYLESFTTNDGVLKGYYDSLFFYVDTRMAFTDQVISGYETGGVDAAMKTVETSEGGLYIDRIRQLVDKIQDSENMLLVQYKKANEKSIRNLQRVLLLIVAGILLLLAVFIRKTRADNKEKIQAALDLKKLNDELELRVIERTEELDKKEKLFRALVENNEGIILLLDEQLNILYRSASTSMITGWQFGEDEKVAASGYLDADDLVNVKALVAEAVADPGKAIPVSIRIKHNDGHFIWLEGSVKNMLHDPAICGIIANLRDISERQKNELKIKSAIERYDILANATSDTIWDWDIVNNTMLYNDGIDKTFGYQASEVENVVDWWNEKLHPDDFKKVTETLEEVFNNGLEKFQLTYRFRCADESYKYVFDRAFVIFDESGNPSRMIGAMQDITFQVEDEIRTSKAIIDAQEKERRYIGAELHDNVNQILASSLLALSMVKKNQTDSGETYGFIEMGKGHIFSAIEEVRKLSHKLAPASFDNNTLRNAFETLLQSFNLRNQYNIKLNFDELCNDIDGDIQINLYRILQEQIKNIAKYANASEIEISVTQTADIVKMRIFDNGKGFNAKTAKKGIGLNNIKKRAESFSGKFILNTGRGKGCEILLELPLAKAV